MKQPGKGLMVFFQGGDLQLKFITRCLIFNLIFKVPTALSGGSHARPRREMPLLLQSTASSQRPSAMLAFTATKASLSSLRRWAHALRHTPVIGDQHFNLPTPSNGSEQAKAFPR